MLRRNKYGLLRQSIDSRDIEYRPKSKIAGIESHDLRHYFDFQYQQGMIGSCVSHGTIEAVEFLYRKTNTYFREPLSRLFQYFNTRKDMGLQYLLIDSGSTIRDGIKTFNRYGSCLESLWTYSDDPIKFRTLPGYGLNTLQLYQNAKQHKSVQYGFVPQDLDTLKAVLLDEFPIVIGIQVYSSFESQQSLKTGDIPDPDLNKDSLLGGHCVVLTSFDNSTQRFGFKNSWGSGFGNGGYGTLSYKYLTDSTLSSDFWVINQTT